jgi:co-chaperonin GroES (HSP10)
LQAEPAQRAVLEHVALNTAPPEQVPPTAWTQPIANFGDRVLALGDLAFKDEEIYRNGPWVVPGDYIVFAKYAGQKFFWKGVQLLLIKASAIELVVEKPEYLDSNFRN